MKKESLQNLFITIFIMLNVVGIFYNGSIFIMKSGQFERALWRMVYSVIALLCYIIFTNISLKTFFRRAPLFFLFSLVLMSMVFIPGFGVTRMGATRWLSIPPLSWAGILIQPAEIAKLSFVLFLSCILGRYFEVSSKEEDSWFCNFFYNKLHWSRFAVAGFFAFILFFLTVFQKDLTMIIFYILLFIAFAWIAGMKFYKILFVTVLIGSLMGFFVLNDSNRKARMTAFLEVEAHRHGAGYQLYHSLISVGSGGLTGKGVNQGDHLFWLSEVENDFILANIAEETGFIGVSLITLLYVLFFVAGMYTVFKLRNFSYQLLAFGLVAVFTLQAIIHYFVVLGLMPTTGIPLPIISYGGTSLAVFGCLFGIMHRLSGEIP